MYTKNQLLRYKQLASTLDYVRCPEHFKKPTPSSIKIVLMIPVIIGLSFGIPAVYSLENTGLFKKLLMLLCFIVLMSPVAFPFMKSIYEKKKENYLEMQKIASSLRAFDTIYDGELSDIFDMESPITRQVIEKYKDLNKHTGYEDKFIVSLLLNMIEEVEREKQYSHKTYTLVK